jgi:hypothetical protein
MQAPGNHKASREEAREQERLIREEVREKEREMRAQEARMRLQEAEMQRKMDQFMEVLTNELLRDKLISDKEDFEFQFKDRKLYINGKKQRSIKNTKIYMKKPPVII